MAVESLVGHIIWDWNGTLLADGEALIRSTMDAFELAGLKPITRTDYQRLHRQPIPAFYDALAGRMLTDAEQRSLDQHFQRAYRRHREHTALTHDALAALALWRRARRSQSLLSMHPHHRLVPLVERFGIDGFFSQLDGLIGAEATGKAPHLRRHLDKLPVKPDRAVLIGDSVDDVLAAQSCGVRPLVYHAGDHALHAREHFTPLRVRVVHSLYDTVAALVDGAGDQVVEQR